MFGDISLSILSDLQNFTEKLIIRHFYFGESEGWKYTSTIYWSAHGIFGTYRICALCKGEAKRELKAKRGLLQNCAYAIKSAGLYQVISWI